MTTDPRVIECAKASYLRLYPGRIWETLLPSERDLATEFVQRAILKWLAQTPTSAMEFKGDEFEGGDEARKTYRAMCAQAAKEIAE